jgi:hypothetical protein
VEAYNQFFYTATDLVTGQFYRFQLSAVNKIGESLLPSEIVSHYAQSLPGVPDSPRRVASLKTSATTASITLAWNPLLVTGGVPITGFKLYSVDRNENIVLQLDATNQPQILTHTIKDLLLD